MRHNLPLHLFVALLLRRVVRPENLEVVLRPTSDRPAGWEGRLNGRPIDFLTAGP